MTVRHRALGRNRGPFAAGLYIRGDVVQQAGALYSAKNTFVATATFTLANWDVVLPAPVIPPASVAAKESTVGPGLPATAGRTAGDLHYNETNKQEYVLVGVNAPSANTPYNGFVFRTGPLNGWVPYVEGNPNPPAQGDTSMNFAANLITGTDTTNGQPSTAHGRQITFKNSVGNTVPGGLGTAEANVTPGTGYNYGQASLASVDSVEYLITGPDGHVDLDATWYPFGHPLRPPASSTLTWVSTDDYVAPHSHPASGSTNTIGVGLPGLIGRTNGDQHYDTAAKKEYVHVGSLGSGAISDSLAYADETTLNGQVTPVGAKTWVASGFVVRNGRAVLTGTSGTAAVNTGSTGARTTAMTFSMDRNNNDVNLIIVADDASLGGQFLSLVTDKRGAAKLRRRVAGVTTDLATIAAPAQDTYVAGQAYFFEGSVTATGLITVKVDGKTLFEFQDSAANLGALLTTSTFTGVSMAGTALDLFFDNFTTSTNSTLKWENANTDVAPHSHGARSTQAAVNSIGDGLPGFGGRQRGDLHYETLAGRAFILAGTPGTADIEDDFNRTAGSNVIGSTTSKGAAVWGAPAGSNATIHSSGTYVTSTNGSQISVPLGSGDIEVGVTLLGGVNNGGGVGYGNQAVGAGFRWNFLVSPVNSGTGVRVSITRDGNSFDVVDFGTADPNFAASPRRLSVRTEGGLGIGGKIHVYIDGVLRGTKTADIDSSGGTVRAGITVPGTGADDFSALSIGTLMWNPSEPIYLQAQLASGPVATGTHVLKPGIRVPSASALKEVVLRCDTAPVGAPITVQVERFNNGTSQGVIATASITDGMNVGSVSGLNALMAKGDILKFNITSVGSTTAGSDLTVSLDAR